MRQRTRLALALAGVVVAVAVATILIAPRLLDLQSVRSQIVEQLSHRLGADITIGSLRLSYFPVPHLDLTTVALSIPNRVEGTFATVSVHPRLLPLLRGQVQLEQLSIGRATAKITAPAPPETGGELSISALRESLGTVLAGASALKDAIGPGAVLVVEDGRIEIDGASVPVALHDVDARVRLPPANLEIDITAAANLAQRLTLTTALDAQRQSGTLRADLERLRLPPPILASLPDTWPRVQEAEVNLGLDVTSDGSSWNGTVRGSFPVLAMASDDQSVAIRGASFRGALAGSEATIRATLETLALEAPRLTVSGHFAAVTTPPQLELALNAADIDVAAAREVALTLIPNVPLVQPIFDVLRGGTATRLVLHGDGANWDALGDAIAIEGTLDGGRIHIPGVNLDLEEVAGQAKIIGGVLEGEQASARLASSTATDGSLRLGLGDDPQVLNLRAAVQADAIALPPLLRGLVPDRALHFQLDQLLELTGHIAGTLTLGGTTDDVSVLVEVPDVNVSGRYRGLSLPLHVSGGPVTVTHDASIANSLDITAGATQIGVSSGRIDWGHAPSMTLRLGPSRIILHELHPALRAVGWLRGSEDLLKAIEGTVTAQSIEIRGPLADPRKWYVAVNGAVSDFDLDSAARETVAFRAPISMTNMALRHDGTARNTSLSTNFSARGGIQGTVDALWNRGELAIKRSQIRDRASSASLSLLTKPQRLGITFAGRLEQSTVATLLSKPDMIGTALSGDFRADIPLRDPVRTDIQGRLQIHDIPVPLPNGRRWNVDSLTVDGEAKQAHLQAVIRTAVNDLLEVTGTVRPSAEAMQVDLDVGSDEVNVVNIEPVTEINDRADDADVSQWLPPIRGTMRVAADAVRFRDFVWRDVRATVTLASDQPEAHVSAATLCGIATLARITDTKPGVRIALQTLATHQPLDPALECLFGDPGLTSGYFNLSTDITLSGTVGELARSAEGSLVFAATDGRINRVSMLARLFSVLSLATGSLGNAFKLTNEGLPYDRITVRGDIDNGVLQLTQAVFDGPTVKIVGEGSIDLVGDQLDMTLLVAPLVTVDRIIAYIPIIRHVLGGIVSVPVKVRGTLEKPAATPLDPGVVSRRLLGGMQQTISLPFRLIRPILPGAN